MNVHEYQAKELLRGYGVPLAQGAPAFTVEEAVAAAQKLPGPVWVVKAQIHAGGRGKGKFKEADAGDKGGVRLARSIDEVRDNARQMLGKTLVTIQTGPGGRVVKRLFIEEGCDIGRELYLSALVDRATSRISFIASTEGGMDIEKVAHDTPDKIVTLSIDPASGYAPFHGRKIASALKLEGAQIDQCVTLIGQLYRAFVDKDMSLLEVNPLVVTKAGKLLCLDAKITFEDNALFRHKDVAELRDVGRGGPGRGGGLQVRLELRQARRPDRLHGQRRRPRHGHHGHHQALWDGARQLPGRRRRRLKEKVAAAFKIILSDPNVKGILVNIFGGIMRCDIIAEGVVAAAKEMAIKVPLVVRLEGTNVDLGKQILAQSGLKIVPADNLADAAKKITDEVKKAG